MTTNPNHVPIHEVTPDKLDALLQRSIEQGIAEREARQRAAAWPSEVEQMLVALAHGLVALRERVDAVEAAIGRN